MKQKRKKSILAFIAAIIIIAEFIVLILRLNSSINSAINSHISDSDVVVGRANASITFIMFGRFNCKYSAKFFDEFYPLLKEKYIDTGRVRFVYKNFNLPKPETVSAEEAALCAHDQGKFFEYSSVLFRKQDEWSKIIDSPTKQELFNPIFSTYANETGLDKKLFLECLYSRKHKDDVEQQYNYATELGINQPPSFYINGLVILGLPSSNDLESVLLKFR